MSIPLTKLPDAVDACDWRESLFEDGVLDGMYSDAGFVRANSVHEVKDTGTYLIGKEVGNKVLDFKETRIVMETEMRQENGTDFPDGTIVSHSITNAISL